MKQYFKNFAVAATLLLAAVFACGGSDTESVRVVQTVVVERQVTQIEKVVETVVVERVVEGKTITQTSAAPGSADGQVQPAPLAQTRIVVHTARMSLVVQDVTHAINRITDVASDLGGWVVNSERTSKHSGTIAIRVPAELLNEAILHIEGLATGRRVPRAHQRGRYRRVRRQ